MTPNPVLEALINARVADIVDPPRSWRKDMKAAFLRLPRDLQIYFAAHERRREAEIKRAQNERALAVQKLAAAEAQLAKHEKIDANAEIKDTAA